MSHMATTIRTQPEELRRLLDDPGPAEAAAQRIAGRRMLLVGIGTSWHAAHHGAWLLREAGIEAAARARRGRRALRAPRCGRGA